MNLEPVLKFDRKPLLYGLITIAVILLILWLVLSSNRIDISSIRFLGNYSIGGIPAAQ
jgi:hypothetical protein